MCMCIVHVCVAFALVWVSCTCHHACLEFRGLPTSSVSHGYYFPLYLRQGPFCFLLLHTAGQLACKLQDPPVSASNLSVGKLILWICAGMLTFMWVLGMQNQILMLAQHMLYPSHFSRLVLDLSRTLCSFHQSFIVCIV